jgi:hypothetical protein
MFVVIVAHPIPLGIEPWFKLEFIELIFETQM